MTNAEKYLKEGIKKSEFTDEIVTLYANWDDVKDEYISFRSYITEWLNEPIKPTLTEDERVILRNIDKKYKYIGRTDYDARMQYLYVNIEDGWKPSTLDSLDHLFQFIKERRRIFY